MRHASARAEVEAGTRCKQCEGFEMGSIRPSSVLEYCTSARKCIQALPLPSPGWINRDERMDGMPDSLVNRKDAFEALSIIHHTGAN